MRSTPSVGPPRPKGAGLAISLIIGLGLFAWCMPPAFRYVNENRVVKLVHHFDQPENTWLKKARLRINTPTKMGRTDITVTYKPVRIKNHRSIKKVVHIQPQFDQDLNAKMSFTYTDEELDGLSEENLILYSSTDEGKTWQPHLNSVVNAENNTVYLEGIEHFSLWTVAMPPAAPGCVAANLKAWYKADVGVTGTSTVTAWADQSGNGIDVIQATPTQAPALSGLINFNPTLLFDGAGDHLEYKGARFLTTSSSGTMYGAATNDIDGGLENLAVLGIDNPHMGINATPGSGVNQQEAFMWMNTSSPVYFYNPTKIEAKRAEVYGFFWNGGSPNVGSGLRRNGTETLDPLSEATGVASSGSVDGMWSIGAYEALEPWNGSIPEIILYDRNLTNTEKQKIESYLAIKYGTTLSQNYLAGDGSTIYDISTYGNNVLGIGRDDCQGLEQKQSKSQNTGFQPILSTTTFAATNVANTTGFTADKSFEIVGSDAGATTFGTAYAFSAMSHRITRLWKIQETGTVGNVKVAIEKSQMSGNASNVNLLVSGDVTFDNSDTKTAMTLETVGGVEYYTATVDFTSGQFFTFGAYLVTPGCVAANLKFWLKADGSNLTGDGTAVSSWENALGDGYDGIQPTAGGRPTYYSTTAANLVNFNPAVSFDGGDEVYNSTRLFANTAAYSMMAVAVDRRTNTGEVRGAMGMLYGNGDWPNLDFQTDGISPNGWNPYSGIDGEFSGSTAPLYALGQGASNRTGNIVGLTTNNVSGGSDNIISYVNGFKENTNISSNQTIHFGNGLYVGSSGGQQWLGLIPEVVVYDRQLSDLEMRRVYSYLALKYGALLTHDYVDGAGTTIYTLGSYGNNVAGIGRDDCQGLVQKQSQSMLAGLQPVIGQADILAATNAAHTGTFSTDKSFLVWGSDNGAATFGTAYAFSGMNNRITRVWKTQETGTVGSVKVALAKQYFGSAEQAHLLSSNDATFDNSDTKTPLTLETVGGVEYYTATIDLTSGQYFTFGAYLSAPGGVAAGLSLWLRADSGTNPSGTGTLSNWIDQAKGNHASQIGTGTLPTLIDGSATLFNFNKAVQFTATDQKIGNIASTTTGSSAYDVFSFTKEGMTGSRFFNIGRNNTNLDGTNWDTPGFYTNGQIPIRRASDGALLYGSNPGGTFDALIPSITYHRFTDVSATKGFNGAATGTVATYGSAGTPTGGYIVGNNSGSGSGGDDPGFIGIVGEFVAYNRNLSTTERRQVDSYMAIKYGITLDQTTVANYLSSDGSVVWGTSTNTGYNNNIAGIARDDASAFLQKQSKSVNSGLQPTIGQAGQLAATNAAHTGTFSTDNSFLVWGSDNGAATFGTPYAFGGMTHRITRVWKTQETGTVGSVKVALPKSDFSGNASQVHLLVSNDATFDNSDTKTPMTLETVGGVEYYTATVDLTSTQHFTFGAYLVTPGCVAANLLTWYKATDGVTGSPSVSAWQDLVNGYNVIQNNVNHRPMLQSATMNFNPALLFDGGDDHLEYTAGRFIATNASGSMFGAATNLGDGSYENLTDLGIDNPHMGKLGTQQIMWMNSSGPVQIVQPGNFATDRSHVWGYFWNGGSPNVGSGLRLNGTEFYEPTTEATAVANSGYVDGLWTIGAYDGVETWNGLIGEIILYDRNLAAWEKDKVESYLAIKYGNTLTHNYYAGDWNGTTGTTLWTLGGGYDNDITGIGRDDCQGLNQKQSKSVNNGLQPVIGNADLLAATNTDHTGNFTTDQSFLLWGANNGAATFGAPYAFSGMSHRLTRIWKTQENGTVGSVKVALPKSDFPGNATQIHLLVSNDATFDNSDTKTPMTLETVGGVEYYTATVDLTSTQHFTFGAYLVTPGCVAANLLTWYKATDGVTGSPSVSAWQDLVNGYNVIQNTPNHQPMLQSAAMNFNPALLFDGGDDHLEYTAGRFIAANASGSMFGAATNIGDGGYENLADLGIDNPHMGKLGTQQIMWMNSSGPVQIVQPGNFATDRPHVWGYFWNGGSPNVGSGLRLNGTEFYEPTTEATAVGSSGYVDGLWTIGAYNGVETWDGLIGEIILYDRNLATWEKDKVETYLAIKYGTTLTHNYYAGDWNGTTGTTVWTLGGGYDNNVAGIGRDDCQALNQKQSKSAYSGLQPVIGNADQLATTNTAHTGNFTADQSFLLWGSDNGSASFGTPYAFGGMTHRISRIWKTQETGTVGSVKVAVPKANFGGAASVNLLRSTDATFDGTDSQIAMTLETVGGVEYYTATVDFSTGDYFSFGSNICGPGGVVSNFVFWLKADAGTSSTTDGASLSSWIDQSLFGHTASQATGSLQPEFKANTGLFNFNPSVTFNPNARLQANLSVTAPWTNKDGTVYVIYNQEVDGAWRNLVDFGETIGDSNSPQLGMTPSDKIGTWMDGGGAQDDSPFTVANGETRMAGFDWTYNVNGAHAYHFDGKVASAGAGHKIGPTIGSFLNIGGDPQLGEYYNGQIAEVVAYQERHTPANRQKVHSYLAIKYGITLDKTDNDGSIVEGNYVASNGAVVWNTSANSSFHNDVAGIGRDDASCFTQKQSKSVNGDDPLVMGRGGIAASNLANSNTFANDLAYVLWGNNNLSATTTTALAANGACGIPGIADGRLNRIWLVQTTGATEITKIKAESLPFNTGGAIYMLVGTDPTMATWDQAIPVTWNASNGETSYNFPANSTKYITFAGSTALPANICTGDKVIRWWDQGWTPGALSKNVTIGDQTFNFTITDAGNVRYFPAAYPRTVWSRLYIPRYDNQENSAIDFKMAMSKPAREIELTVADIDGWFYGKDKVTITGKIGGLPVTGKFTATKQPPSVYQITHGGPPANPVNDFTGSIYPVDLSTWGNLHVVFDRPVDEMTISYKKDNLYDSWTVFNDIQIGDITVRCTEPEALVPVVDNVYLQKTAPLSPMFVNDTFEYVLTLKNLDCGNKTIDLNDNLPATLKWVANTLSTNLSYTAANTYGGTQNLNLTALVVPPGTSKVYIRAYGSTAGTYNNQASFTVMGSGNTYQSDNPAQSGPANPTPVTIVAEPFPTATFTVTKSADAVSVPKGTDVEYTFSFNNTTGSAVTVDFQDYLTDSLTYLPGSLVNSLGGTTNTYANEGILSIMGMNLPTGTSSIKVKVKTSGVDVSNGDNVVPNFAVVIPSNGSGFMPKTVMSNTVNVTVQASADTDGDGKADSIDLDDDNDGILDTVEEAACSPSAVTCDSDGDGIINSFDLDSDNDGINDVREAGGTDANNDGIADGTPDAQGRPVPSGLTPADVDADSKTNPYDLDSDNDAISDLTESGATGLIDADNNGVVDGPDADNDGIRDSADGNDALVGDASDPTPANTDGTDNPDYTDIDSDNDGLKDIREVGRGALDANNDGFVDSPSDPDNDGIANNGGLDGLPAAFGGLTAPDRDGDGVADSADLDDDNDGILDTIETTADLDGDGIPNSLDLDSDNDGINDVREAGGTDAGNDGIADGAPDGQGRPVPAGLNPADTDADGKANPYDLDSDNDAISDLVESGHPGLIDANNNGVVDGPDADADGIQDSADGIDNAFGDVSDPAPVNTDGTDNPDYTDVDSDNDGINDIKEIGRGSLDGNNDGRVDSPTDPEGDGIANNGGLDTQAGGFGGLRAPDNDADGVPNNLDLDDDNDGILDSIETTADVDGDGISNNLDLDSDNDGINDVREAGGTDADNNGIADGSPDGQGRPVPAGLNPADTDADGKKNPYDLDSDNDAISDLVENGTPGLTDIDNNGVVDGPDADGDGIQDSADGTDTTFGDTSDPLPVNTDATDTPDYIDVDSDNNGTKDIAEAGYGALDGNNDGRVDSPTDVDGDGIADNGGLDAQPAAFGGLAAPDNDNDGVLDSDDLDDDNDGILDTTEASACSPSVSGCDTDGDGIPNRLDLDSDNDGINDVREAGGTDANNNGIADGTPDVQGRPVPVGLNPADTDADGKKNPYDLDSDNDGVSDLVESGMMGALADADNNGVVDGPDADGDGIRDSADGNDAAFGDAADSQPANLDGTDTPDYIDLDSDNDGLFDIAEAGNPTLDANNDGQVDSPSDPDGDGIANNGGLDTQPAAFGGLSAPDVDNDGVPDANDLDDDNDGILDAIESTVDTDGDGIPNFLDLDSDNDGINDVREAGGTDNNGDGIADGTPDGQGRPVPAGLTPADSDGDGKTNPYDLDSDNDGLSDLVESGQPGVVDTDNNGVVDGPDADSDGIRDSADATDTAFGDASDPLPVNTDGAPDNPDYLDTDSDDDGIFDIVEAGYNNLDGNADGKVDNPTDADGDGIANNSGLDTQPAAFGGLPLPDVDGDGTPDASDLDDDNDGILDTVETTADSDGDGIPNRLDLDSDNDGINDVREAGGIDADNDGIADGTPDGQGRPVPAGLTPADTDGDGKANPYDLDSDNDGISDLVESGATGIADADNNGVVDGPDDDGDGIRNSADGNPNTTGDVSDPLPVNTDGLDTPDYIDADSNNNGVFDIAEGGHADLDGNNDGKVDSPTDPDGDGIANNGGLDILPGGFGGLPTPDGDGDGVADIDDLDDDNDGILDNIEAAACSPAAQSCDTDGDGIVNRLDLDSDNDGINDVREAGGTDSDGNGIADGSPNGQGSPVAGGLNPADTDLDSKSNPYDLDSDNDGIADLVESGTPGLIDADNNGVVDGPDTDSDGIRDSADGNDAAFGDASDPQPVNTDGLDTPDYIDTDSNNNGTTDITEAGYGPLDTDNDGRVDNTADPDGDGITNQGDLDTQPAAFGGLPVPDNDGDGTPDSSDLDDDNDGILDALENAACGTASTGCDSDGDGIPNRLDLDSDNDGLNDVREAGGADANNNGIADGTPDGQGRPVPAGLTAADTDGDTKRNPYDLDSDNDGISDLIEGGQPGLIDADDNGVVDGPDADLDGIRDSADADDAAFGDATDPLPANLDGTDNPDYIDTDSNNNGIFDIGEIGRGSLDGNGDGRVDSPTDPDGDGIANNGGLDSQPAAFGGLSSPDKDSDGAPDSSDLDDDNDGILDTVEESACSPSSAACDSDVDGIPNRLDLDSDNDGINDVREAGGTDADNNGLADGTPNGQGAPVPAGLTPPDSDSDSKLNPYDLDSDNDAISDLVESGLPGLIDADNNGVVDGPDADSDGIRDSADGIDTAFGDASDPLPTNSDGTDSPNYTDLDSDNDGVKDIAEGGHGPLDANNDGRVDSPTDADGDGVANNAGLDTAPTGYGGLSAPDVDGDGTSDVNDLDADNDGILNSVEDAVCSIASASCDTDGDGIPNRLDLDSDNDGINDVREAGGTDANNNGMADGTPDAQGRPVPAGLTPPDSDTDGKANPYDLDSDNDSVSDLIEGGAPGLTDANNDGVVDGPDTDGDGIRDSADGNDALIGDAADPLPVNTDATDSPDYTDPDSDNDGLNDIVEAGHGSLDGNNDGRVDSPSDPDGDGVANNSGLDTQPAAFGGLPAPDIDGDGTPDVNDLDDDNDGIADAQDPKPQDTDNDGTPNVTDTDDDGDGILDTVETPGQQLDTDNDGTPNATDTDDDGDGIPDTIEQGTLVAGVYTLPDVDNDGIPDLADQLDTDGDGTPDMTDNDDDGDGLTDAQDPKPLDTDNDGTPNDTDTDDDGDGILDTAETPGQQLDTDNDATPNATDTDDDGDGIPDTVEQGTLVAGVYTLPDVDNDGIPDLADQLDTDGDGTPDVADTDDDGDGLTDTEDPKPLDTDNDGINNATDPDDDGDGILDTAETPGQQLDTDNDGTPNATDSDDDGDNIPDTTEQGTLVAGVYTLPDVDNDGVPDLADPLDTDGDGIPDLTDTDDDGDGLSDAQDPKPLDTDNDGTPNATDPDDDGDGILDTAETAGQQLDTDNDGTPNATDPDDDGDNIPDTTEQGTLVAGVYTLPDVDNDGIPDLSDPLDTDGDGTSDIADTDDDGDGLSDAQDPKPLDTDNDGTPNATDPDDDGDGILDAAETAGQQLDTDNDGTPNATDTDDDGDNIPDTTEQGTLVAGVYTLPDVDNDGIPDLSDPLDTDGDGTPDLTDTDDDGDGLSDAQDPKPLDTDNDGTPNATDPDDDGDGILDTAETPGQQLDTDNDGTPNATDPDDDGDNIPDTTEQGTLVAGVYTLPDSDNDGIPDLADSLDTDGDGVPDVSDADDDGDGLPDAQDPKPLDTDNDGTPNATDPDDDGDGILDTAETAGQQLDTDNDGTPNATDPDDDGDGIPDTTEQGALVAGVYTLPDSDNDGVPDLADPLDTDGDTLPDVVDTDDDADGIPDAQDPKPLDTDNDGINNATDPDDDGDGIADATEVPAARLDTDNDGTPNATDPDDDNDSIPDTVEQGPLVAGVYTLPDSDGDGLPDLADPLDTDGDGTPDVTDTDDDGDGLSDDQDPKPLDTDNDGINNATDPDDDGDGILDTAETAGQQLDTDNDGTPNATDTDDDGDGIPDSTEQGSLVAGVYTLPDSDNDGRPDLIDAIDTDGDGIPDLTDTDDDGDGLSDVQDPKPLDTDNDGSNNATDPDDDGDGIPDITDSKPLDTDNDGTPNATDTDDDGDGIPDTTEQGTLVAGVYTLPDVDNDGTPDLSDPLDSDGDGVHNGLDTDADNDGIPNAVENATAQNNGDTDNDGTPDYLDLDSDADGIKDIVEAGGTDTNNDGKLDNPADTDGDGLANTVDPDNGGSVLPTPDTDNDNTPNFQDNDSDNDGLTDQEETTGVDDPLTTAVPTGISNPLDPCDPVSCGLSLTAKVFLGGAYDELTGMMHDSLRKKNLIPLNQPYNTLTDYNYNGTESVNATVFATTGANAIVDWVLVELHDKNNPATVLYKRAALVQRDGDIVDTDGSSPLFFTGAAVNSYYVSVKHRNHLGVMSAASIAMTTTPAVIDFTSGITTNYKVAGARGSDHAQQSFAGNKRALWAGNMANTEALPDPHSGDRVIYQGPAADVEEAYFVVLLDSTNNIGVLPVHIVASVYNRADANMDGKVIYQGDNADTDVAFFTVSLFPDNANALPIFVVYEQIPK